MVKCHKFTVKFRLDEVLVEVRGVRGFNSNTFEDGLKGAIENAKRLCLMHLTKEYKGMTLEHLDGQPRVVGVETFDAWPD